jgi:protein-glutamine gamma-glutamyltransferase
MNSLILLSLGLSIWAWLLKTWLAAAVLLAMILLAKVSRWHWQLTLNQFYRWGDLSSLLVVLLLAYLYLWQNTDRPIFIVLKWLPLLFAPVLLAQLFSSTQQLPLGTLFYSFRKRQEGGAQTVDFQLPYTALTLLSAGAGNVAGLNYFVSVTALFIAILWTVRPKQGSVFWWLLLIALTLPVSHLGQLGLRRLQNIIEYQTLGWLGGWQTDPFKTRT